MDLHRQIHWFVVNCWVRRVVGGEFAHAVIIGVVHMVVDVIGSFARINIRRDRAVEGGAGLSRCIINAVVWRSVANLESVAQTDLVGRLLS